MPVALLFRRAVLAALVVASGLASLPALAATLIVTSTLDSAALGDLIGNGTCELREAITNANVDGIPAGAVPGDCPAGGTNDVIAFNIPGAGPHIITLAAALPDIVAPLQIDGYTQPGAAPNTLSAGTNADIRVGIANGGGVIYGVAFTAGASSSSLRGLRVTGFTNAGVILTGTGGLANVTIAGNFIGTDGTNALPNFTSGVFVLNGVTDSVIGGPASADRNLIAGNGSIGVSIGNSDTTGISVINNLIGTRADGITPLFNTVGIQLNSAGGNTVSGNVIGGAYGVEVTNLGADDNTITNNLIGVGTDGSADIGGANHGIVISAQASGAPFRTIVGGAAAGAGNRIANWGGDGIRVERFNNVPHSSGNSFLGNAIYNNGGLGINLRDQFGGTGDGVNANDNKDLDTGSNAGQNFPVVLAATTDGIGTTVDFSLNTNEPILAESYRFEFFASPSCNASGHGEGSTFLGSTEASVDSFGFVHPAPMTGLPAVPVGQVITMTATQVSFGNTSEFSACVAVTAAAPPQTPPILGDIPDQTFTQGAVVSFPLGAYITATDGDAVTCAISAGSLPPGLSLNAFTCVVFGTPTAIGIYPASATATDNDGTAGPDAFTITVLAAAGPHTPPILADVPDQTFPVGTSVNFDLAPYVTPTDGDPVSFAVTGPLPPGMWHNSGLLGGTPTAPGVYTITVVASDNDGASAPDSVTITVPDLAAAGAVQPVPVLSPIGLALLSLLLGGFGASRRVSFRS